MTKRHPSRYSPTIRLRLFVLALGGALLFFSLAGALDIFGREDAAEKAFVRAGQQRAEAVAAMATAPGKPLALLASAVASQADVLEVTLRTADGKTLVQQIRPNRDDAPRRIFRAPARFSSGGEGTLELHLAETGAAGGYGRIVWPFAVMALLFAGVLFIALSRMLVHPLEKLVRRARELTDERDLDAPIILRVEGYAELRDVTHILNTMSRRVFDVKQQMEEKVNHANTALVSTVGQLQSRSAELRERSQELEVALEAIKRIATTDSLTGLHNRRYFDERLGNALARLQRSKQPISMILFDIDKFKHINDTLGHAAGDAVLENLARLIKSRTRVSDVFARLGGDEFAFIMENTNLPEATKLGTDLLASVVAHQFTYESHTIPVTLSIGIAHFDQPPRDAEIIYKVTDDALYDAKRNGRNQVVACSFDPNGNRLNTTPEKPA
jgi:diguanylate cyclase (GGDEF)-like protein